MDNKPDYSAVKTTQDRRKLGRSESIQVMRGLASLAVAWYHLTSENQSITKQFGSLGWLGVEVFFVISGFVIPLSIWNSSQSFNLAKFPAFMARRIVRIEPPYLISVVLVLVLWKLSELAPSYAGKPFEFDPVGVLAHVAYLVPWTGSQWLQPVYWSLAWEFVFYIFVGLFFPLISGNRVVWAGLVLAVIIAVLCGFPAASLLFVIGMATYRAMTGMDRAAFALAAIVLVAVVLGYVGKPAHAIVASATAILIFVLYDYELRGKFGRALIWFGTISYSLYLVHVPIGGRVVNLGRRFVSAHWLDELLLSLAGVAVSLIAAAVFYRLVEQPSIRASRSISGLRSGSRSNAPG